MLKSKVLDCFTWTSGIDIFYCHLFTMIWWTENKVCFFLPSINIYDTVTIKWIGSNEKWIKLTVQSTRNEDEHSLINTTLKIPELLHCKDGHLHQKLFCDVHDVMFVFLFFSIFCASHKNNYLYVSGSNQKFWSQFQSSLFENGTTEWTRQSSYNNIQLWEILPLNWFWHPFAPIRLNLFCVQLFLIEMVHWW